MVVGSSTRGTREPGPSSDWLLACARASLLLLLRGICFFFCRSPLPLWSGGKLCVRASRLRLLCFLKCRGAVCWRDGGVVDVEVVLEQAGVESLPYSAIEISKGRDGWSRDGEASWGISCRDDSSNAGVGIWTAGGASSGRELAWLPPCA